MKDKVKGKQKEQTTEQAEEPAEEQTEKEKEKEHLRTCSMTLRSIIRPDMRDHQEQIRKILEEKQLAMTTMTDEPSTIVQETLLVVGRMGQLAKRDSWEILFLRG